MTVSVPQLIMFVPGVDAIPEEVFGLQVGGPDDARRYSEAVLQAAFDTVQSHPKAYKKYFSQTDIVNHAKKLRRLSR